MEELSCFLTVELRLLQQGFFALQGGTSAVTARYTTDVLSFALLLQMRLTIMYSTEKCNQCYLLKQRSGRRLDTWTTCEH